jgi:hypothetical protein
LERRDCKIAGHQAKLLNIIGSASLWQFRSLLEARVTIFECRIVHSARPHIARDDLAPTGSPPPGTLGTKLSTRSRWTSLGPLNTTKVDKTGAAGAKAVVDRNEN